MLFGEAVGGFGWTQTSVVRGMDSQVGQGFLVVGTFFARGLLQAAAERFRANPQAKACHDRGVAHYHRKECSEAIAELTRAIELDPTVA